MEAKYRELLNRMVNLLQRPYKAFTLKSSSSHCLYEQTGRVPVKVKSNVDKRRPGEQEAHLDIKYSWTEVKGFDTKGL